MSDNSHDSEPIADADGDAGDPDVDADGDGDAEVDPDAVVDDGDVDTDSYHAFWADEIADRIEARLADHDEADKPIVIKGGVSPSGVAHLGNVNEIMRGFFVAEVLRARGHDVRQVFTSDDKDPLRKLPRKLADETGTIVGLGEVDAGALGRNLGKPYTAIPDPFGERESYAAHFAALLEADADRLGVDLELYSNTALYADGTFEPVVRHVLEHADRAREVLSQYQASVDADYVPFNPVCSECGKLTETVTAIDLDSETVDYVCTDMTVGDTTIEGCGHEGTASFREGKLPWRFEWPAQWQVLGVDFEPFGKDHAEGSWPSGVDIAERVLDIEPPVPMVYEWFTLNGEALSSSAGNIVTVTELLELLEPEIIRYFFARNPNKARDLDLSRLDQLVDEFDRFERAYYGEVDDDRLTAFAEAAYPHVVDEVSNEQPLRLPYTFAAVLGMVDDPAFREKLARDEGHIPADADSEAIARALARVENAREWAERNDNQYNYRLQAEMPDVDIDATVASALDALAEVVADGATGEEMQAAIYDVARDHDLAVGDLFEAGYRLFFDETQGPRLGEFLGDLEREFVVDRLRRER